MREPRDEGAKMRGESFQSSKGVSTRCKENHFFKKELEELQKENSEIIEELEDGDHENKTLKEIIGKNDENVKLLVRSVS